MFLSLFQLMRNSRAICFVAASLSLIGVGQPSRALGNPLPTDNDLSAPPVSRGSDFAGSARILYIGTGQVELNTVSSAVSLLVGRAADLEGRPLKLISKPSAQLRIGGNPLMSAGRQDLLLPASKSRVTSGYGTRWDPLGAGWRSHAGVDLAAAYGTPVSASGDGTVATARWQGGYGLLVALDHGSGAETRYGHLSRLSVQEGQQVKKGDVIGYVGSTGRSTGAHLHYEVRESGRAVNPVTSRRK